MSPPAPSAGFPDPGTIRAAERSGNRPLFSVSVHRRRPNKRSPENPPNRKRTRLGLSLRHAPCDRVFTDRQPPGNRPQSHPRESLRLTRPDYSLPQRRSPVARRRDPVGRADRDRAHAGCRSPERRSPAWVACRRPRRPGPGARRIGSGVISAITLSSSFTSSSTPRFSKQ